MSRYAGFSLLELLLALAISSVLLSGLGAILLDSRSSLRAQAADSRIQENLRFAMATLERDLTAAGHLGCGSAASLESVDSSSNASPYYSAPLPPLLGHEASASGPGATIDLTGPASGWQPSLPAEISGRSRPGSDILRLHRARGGPRPLSRSKEADRVHLHLGHATASGCGNDPRLDGFCPGDHAVLSDCRQARLFRVSEQWLPSESELVLTHNSGNQPVNWGHAADPDWVVDHQRAVVQPVSVVAYYIGTEVDGEPALYRRQDDRTEALVRGVENLQLTFGVDSSGDGQVDRYRQADTIAGNPVLTVRIALLLRSERPLTGRGQPRRNLLMGSAFEQWGVAVEAPDDGRLRRTATRTLLIPNNQPPETP